MDKILLVAKKSALDVYSCSGDELLKNHVCGDSEEAKQKKESHERQSQTLEVVIGTLEKLKLSYKLVYRQELTDICGNSLVISCGGDGTLLDISRYIKDATPILGVNSDTLSSVGYFCIANANNFESMITQLDSLPKTRLNRLEFSLNEKLIDYAVLNEIFFQNDNPSLPLKYKLEVDGRIKEFRSSGLIISTAAGSTGRMYQEGGVSMPIASSELQYLVLGRRGEKPSFARAIIMHSLTPKAGLYVDGGRYADEFSIDHKIHMTSGRELIMYGNLEKKRKEYT